jgi:molecular chaperone DnaJ
MPPANYYQLLEVTQQATQQEIKQAYRRLAKHFHPDLNGDRDDRTKIVELNAAYEILKDPQSRRLYDYQLNNGSSFESATDRARRTAKVQNRYQQQKQTEGNEELRQVQWLSQVYKPIDRLIGLIVKPLKSKMEDLSADPFDDDLMQVFQTYLEDCRVYLQKAEKIRSSRSNPPRLAAVAANLYHCLNQLSDAVSELEYYTANYDDYYLKTGREIFRIARGLRQDARDAVKAIGN